jgi:hypothetical protein
MTEAHWEWQECFKILKMMALYSFLKSERGDEL